MTQEERKSVIHNEKLHELSTSFINDHVTERNYSPLIEYPPEKMICKCEVTREGVELFFTPEWGASWYEGFKSVPFKNNLGSLLEYKPEETVSIHMRYFFAFMECVRDHHKIEKISILHEGDIKRMYADL